MLRGAGARVGFGGRGVCSVKGAVQSSRRGLVVLEFQFFQHPEVSIVAS